MIAIDTSAIVAILMRKPEADAFLRLILGEHVIVGTSTLIETCTVLEQKLPGQARRAVDRFLDDSLINIVAFDAAMFEAGADAFLRSGKGRGHPAQLNFRDCFTYAVARTYAVPLLFNGDDFVHTDFVPAFVPAS
ncbi:Ribonuclease VapC42 [Methylobacterium cerastii]|uniref:Ribonuclease VapC n=1 Tax=Methylobacterium cerastii TaxID=932741 RepID=A0ABQ4QHA6_9HYPH|nr:MULTISPECIES: type II toxin-antitoxin system VapC family toxin [Methylobacterium]TXN80935.1 type II toxin-antitoxin system VapC family toxin [Methylobacterium sp. WL8]GJD44625.1 Ribonuclease VapC42 [Methylobacterium cerastii]